MNTIIQALLKKRYIYSIIIAVSILINIIACFGLFEAGMQQENAGFGVFIMIFGGIAIWGLLGISILWMEEIVSFSERKYFNIITWLLIISCLIICFIYFNYFFYYFITLTPYLILFYCLLMLIANFKYSRWDTLKHFIFILFFIIPLLCANIIGLLL